MKTIIGIDPGAKGGIVILWENGAVCVSNMPATPKDILEFFYEFFHRQNVVAYMEDVGHGMPGQSSSATAKFARHCGHLEMALYAAGVPVIKVLPSKWMKSLGIGTSKTCASHAEWKNKLKAKAQERFPIEKVTLNNCDALLIADYGWKQEN